MAWHGWLHEAKRRKQLLQRVSQRLLSLSMARAALSPPSSPPTACQHVSLADLAPCWSQALSLERWRSFVGELLDIKRRVRKCVVAIQLKVVRAAFRCWVARRKPHRLHSACSRRAARWRLSRLVVSVAAWNCRGVVTAFSRLCPYARDRPWQAASQHDVPR